MNIKDITKISHKRYSESSSNNKSINKPFGKKKYLKNLMTRILLSTILVITTLILVKIDDRNLLYIEEHVFTDSIKFTEINNWYQSHIGKIVPTTNPVSEMVFSSSDLTKSNFEDYLDGVKIDETKGNPISIIYGGIVVFIGEKEGYGNTLIIQGNDGIDYWYGNITNVNVNLYDYLEKDTLIGECKDDYIYLVLEKDGKYLNYEEYSK